MGEGAPARVSDSLSASPLSVLVANNSPPASTPTRGSYSLPHPLPPSLPQEHHTPRILPRFSIQKPDVTDIYIRPGRSILSVEVPAIPPHTEVVW